MRLPLASVPNVRGEEIYLKGGREDRGKEQIQVIKVRNQTNMLPGVYKVSRISHTTGGAEAFSNWSNDDRTHSCCLSPVICSGSVVM